MNQENICIVLLNARYCVLTFLRLYEVWSICITSLWCLSIGESFLSYQEIIEIEEIASSVRSRALHVVGLYVCAIFRSVRVKNNKAELVVASERNLTYVFLNPNIFYSKESVSTKKHTTPFYNLSVYDG